jgi:hypothetical protein
MKNINTTQKKRAGIRQPVWLWRAALAGLTIAASVGVSRADQTINTFDTSSEVSEYSYQNWNGSASGSESFSANQSTISGSPTSGSMEIQVVYGGAGQNGGTFVRSGGPWDLSQATGIDFDAMIDPSSPLDNNNNAMEMKVGFNSPSYTAVADQWIGVGWGGMTLGVWQHFHFSFVAGTLGASAGQFFLQCMNYSYNNVAYTPIVYIDNIVVDIPAANYPDYVAFTFDNTHSLTASNCTAGTIWYGEPTTVTWDSTENSTISNPDITPVAGSGAMHIVASFDADNLNNSDVIALAFDTNYFSAGAGSFPANDTNVVIDGTHYATLEFDVLWDTNLSTMSITNFNSMGDITGVPIGLLQTPDVNGGSGVELSTVGPAIPNAASNGWVHLTVPIPQNIPNLNQIVGLFFKKYGDGANGPFGGTAAYWLDNIVFVGGPKAIPQPAMSISQPVQGLNIVNNSGGGYDRESLLTLQTDYSWVDQPGPVTYAMGIASFPSVKYAGYDARFYLVPSASATEAEPDWTENYLAMISVYLDGSGKANATIGCKDSEGGNGNGDLYDSTNPVFTTTNSPIVGTWSFKFSHNTNILVTAPDGESTNWTLPLLSSSALESDFGTVMEVYLGGYNNGTANIGQRVVFSYVHIYGGSDELYDNFLADETINYYETGGPWYIDASDGSVPAAYIIPANTTTKWYLDWSLPANGFSVQTNSNLSTPGAWAAIPALTAAQYGDHMHSEVDVTNLPSSSSEFYRLSHP